MIPTIESNKDLTSLTTFGIPVRARWYAEYSSEKELLWLSRQEEFTSGNVLHIGGGSNLLFLHDYDGLVLRSAIRDIVRYDKSESVSYVIAGAGVKWTDFVDFCLQQNLAGAENLAGIPGDVGAAPVQNVGAYGVEAADIIAGITCFDTFTRSVVRIAPEDCAFAYRDSKFKNEWKGRYFVLKVAFRLVPGGMPQHLEYGPLKSLSERLGRMPSIREVAEEVISIRNSKLPDPAVIGSAGSFFKNPEIRKRYHQELEELSGIKIPCHTLPPDPESGVERVKLNAAWLIDQAGLKGTRIGGAQVYPQQPLVIVNTGNATAEDVEKLASLVERQVRRKFYIHLFREVNYIDTGIKVTVLGSGTSKGMPELGCLCDTCQSHDPRDHRLRASIILETMGMRILIDASPDFREQAMREGIEDVDAVLITHSHYDHVGGIDDLRPFCGQKHIPMFVREDVDHDLHARIDYCFYSKKYPGVPTFDMFVIPNQPFFFKGVKIMPVEVLHGTKPIYGYRIGNFAYITDAKHIPEEELEKLYGLDVLILNCLRERDHFAHLNLSEALEIIARLKPRQAYLTHFCHEIGRYEILKSKLPANVAPAYDGLSFLVE